MKVKKIEAIHPGEILLEEFLKPMDLSQNRLADDIGVPPRRINEIIYNNKNRMMEAWDEHCGQSSGNKN